MYISVIRSALRWSLEEGLPNQIYLGSQTILLLILLGDLGPRGTSHEMEVGFNRSAHHRSIWVEIDIVGIQYLLLLPPGRSAGLLLIIWGPRPHVLRSQLGPARWASPPSPHNRILVELQCCCERSTGPYRTINPLPAGKGSCCIPIAEAQRLAVDLPTTIIRHAVPDNTLSTSIQPSFPSPCPTARPLIIIPFQPGSLPTTRLAKWP